MDTIEYTAEIPYNEIFWCVGGLLFAGGVCVAMLLVRQAIPSITVAVEPREERVRLELVQYLRDIGAEEREIGVRVARFLAIEYKSSQAPSLTQVSRLTVKKII